MSFLVRSARATDYAAFVRLFAELEVDDPIIDEAKFVQTFMPGALVAEAEGGAVVGYTYFQIMKDLAYVRHIATAPEARRTGVGLRLMAEVAAQARAAGCTTWCLNVKPANVAAIALYEKLGLARAHASKALEIAWSIVEGGDRVHDARVTARLIEPADDARVETAMGLVSGQLASARAAGGRVLVAIYEDEGDGRVVGATIFDPSFPGAYPFRAARPELAMVLLRAIRPSARPEHKTVRVNSEGQPEVAEALLAAGATLKMDSVHMRGPLP